MNLIPHIFRKDVRHFYPEILVNVGLLLAFAWSAPELWAFDDGANAARIVPVVLRLLLPLGWFVLVSRLLHDEALVGDRQFWITRPYVWRALLFEKMLFVVVFLHLPLLLMQMYLLQHAGLAVGPAVKDLLLYQAMIAAVYVLPFTALSVVTATFGRHVLSLLGGLVYGVAVGIFGNLLTKRRMTPPNADWVMATVAIITLVTMVIAMYARRRVKEARVVLVCLPLVLVLVLLCLPTRWLIRRVYAGTGSGLSLAFDVDSKQQQTGLDAPLRAGNDVLLQLPLRLQGLGAEAEEGTKGVQLTLRAADGFVWRSPFEKAETWFRSGRTELVSLYVPARIYERIQSRPVDLEMQLAVETYSFGTPARATVPVEGTFSAPDGAVCATVAENSVLQCRYPLQPAQPDMDRFEVQDVPCRETGPRHDFIQRTDGMIGAYSFDFDPVSTQNVMLQTGKDRHSLKTHFLCPGAPVSMARERMVGHEVLMVRQGQVSLPLYVTHRHGLDRPESGQP